MTEMSSGQVCRACLQETTNVRKLNNEGTDEEHELLDKFQILTDLEVKEVEAGYICTLCINNLIFSFNFRKQCIESDKQIQSNVQIEITDNPIKEERLSADEIETKPKSTRLIGYSYEEVISALERLKSKYNETEKMTCLKCNFQANRLAVVSHVAKAHKEIKGKWCSRCNIIIPDLEIHLNDVHEANDQKCEFCGRIMISKSQLIHHLHRHVAMRAFECQICAKNFIVNRDLVYHMKRMHEPKEPTAPLKCPHCPRELKSLITLKAHLNKHKRDGTLLNTNAEDEIIQKPKRKRSVKIHDSGFLSTEKKYLCYFCGRTFGSSDVLRVHMRLHTTELKVNKRFRSKEKPFSCRECSKTFSQRNLLKLHMFVHSTERPFSCETCGKKFKEKRGFKKHNLTHLDQKPFKCDQCNFSCIQKGYLKKHKDKWH